MGELSGSIARSIAGSITIVSCRAPGRGGAATYPSTTMQHSSWCRVEDVRVSTQVRVALLIAGAFVIAIGGLLFWAGRDDAAEPGSDAPGGAAERPRTPPAPQPPTPFPTCGEDPSADALECESYNGC